MPIPTERDAAYDSIYYTASLIEFIGRKTLNHRASVVDRIGKEGFIRLVNLADVNHCLSFEQVSDEVIDEYEITAGNYDTISTCRYQVPSYLSIGSVYAKLASRIAETPKEYPEILFQVMRSGISDAISNFNSSFFFASSDEIEHYYRNEYTN